MDQKQIIFNASFDHLCFEEKFSACFLKLFSVTFDHHSVSLLRQQSQLNNVLYFLSELKVCYKFKQSLIMQSVVTHHISTSYRSIMFK